MSFDQEFFRNNRLRLMIEHPGSLIFVAANTPMQRSGDSCFPFRQDSNFWYLTGIDEPNLLLVLDTIKTQETLILAEKTEIEEIFDGPTNVFELNKISGIKTIISSKDSETLLKNIPSGQKVYLNLAKNRPNMAVNPHRQEVQKKIKAYSKKISDIRPSLDHLRMVKQPVEIAAIKKASEVTKEILKLVSLEIENGIESEATVFNFINSQLASRGLTHAYEPIVASGKNSLTLHYIKNNSLINSRTKALLIDCGVEYNHYCADISRTFTLNSDKTATKLIEALKITQARIIDALKPGMQWKELHKLSEQIMIEELQFVGEKVDSQTIKQYYPHAIGHHLGLDVHDTGDYRKPLTENMVVTIEPGYYNPKNEFGIRVEDDVLVTSSGAVIL